MEGEPSGDMSLRDYFFSFCLFAHLSYYNGWQAKASAKLKFVFDSVPLCFGSPKTNTNLNIGMFREAA